MQEVSQEWKDNQNNSLVSESYVEVVLKLADPDSLSDASATDNGALDISNTSQIVSEVAKEVSPYATLERNLWVLDGSREILPLSDYGDMGFIGKEMSGTDGVFTRQPLITIKFSEVHTKLIPGMTITWGVAYDEYPTDFTITVYNGDTIVATKEVIGNSNAKSVIEMDIIDYDKITISIAKWCLPYRRARLSEILLGIEKIYSKNDLFSFSHTQDVDPLSTSLPKYEISFSIDNTDNSYNPYNLDSFAKYLSERQEIQARYGFLVNGKKELIKCGTFYISEWDAPQNGITADFVARDLLEFMTGTYYKGVYYPDGISLYDLAIAVLEDANLPLDDSGGLKYVIDESLKDIYTVAPLPVDTHANCLQLIANAGCCVMYQDREGVLHIEHKEYSSDTDYEINNFNSYSKSDISLQKPLKQVDVKWYSYSVSEEETELYNATLTLYAPEPTSRETWILTYSNSAIATSVKCTKPSVIGGVWDSRLYTNACELVTALTGDYPYQVKGYVLETSCSTKTTKSGNNGEIITVDNPLITSQERAEAVGKWVESYMKNRMNLSSEWRADPRLDVLDVVKNVNDYNTNNELITNIKYSYNGTFKGSCEGRVI